VGGGGGPNWAVDPSLTNATCPMPPAGSNGAAATAAIRGVTAITDGTQNGLAEPQSATARLSDFYELLERNNRNLPVTCSENAKSGSRNAAGASLLLERERSARATLGDYHCDCLAGYVHTFVILPRVEEMASCGEWVSFSLRPEWADVSPVLQHDADDAPARISYPAKYSETMSYFRAVWLSGETSSRAFDLTTEVLRLNLGHYTAWQHRRSCILALHRSVEEELAFTAALAEDSPKNYQLWHHRRWAIGQLPAADAVVLAGEKEFTASLLRDEGKNYHAWSHRVWVLDRHRGWGGEDTFCQSLLAADVRNNSSWSHKYQAWLRMCSEVGDVQSAWLERVSFTMTAITATRLNEAAWNHLRALCRWAATHPTLATVVCLPPPSPSVAMLPAVASFSLRLDTASSPIAEVIMGPLRAIREAAEPDVNVFANEFLADCLVGRSVAAPPQALRPGDAAYAVDDGTASACAISGNSTGSPDGTSGAAAASRALRLLAACCEADPVHAPLWTWRCAGVQQVLAALQGGAGAAV